MDLVTAVDKYYFVVLSYKDRILATDYIFGFTSYQNPTLVKVAPCLHGVEWTDKFYPVIRPVIMKKSEMPYKTSNLFEVILGANIMVTDYCVEYFSQNILPIKDMQNVINLVNTGKYPVALRQRWKPDELIHS